MIRDFKEMLDLEISSWRFCRSPNSLCMGFTFLMDANTSKYSYNYFMGMKQTLIGIEKFKNLRY